MARHGETNRGKVLRVIRRYDASPEEAGAVESAAGAKMLAFTHLVPSVPKAMTGLVIAGADRRYNGPIRAMRDGDLLSINGRDDPSYRNLLD